MEGYVYLLKSKNNNWHYIGSTTDLRNRVVRHNGGRVKSTKYYKPFSLIYYEAYNDYGIAKKREYELKNNNYKKEMLYNRLGIK